MQIYAHRARSLLKHLPKLRLSHNDQGNISVDSRASSGVFSRDKSNVISGTYGAQFSSPGFRTVERTIASKPRKQKFPNRSKKRNPLAASTTVQHSWYLVLLPSPLRILAKYMKDPIVSLSSSLYLPLQTLR
jgi:hypothetical protein